MSDLEKVVSQMRQYIHADDSGVECRVNGRALELWARTIEKACKPVVVLEPIPLTAAEKRELSDLGSGRASGLIAKLLEQDLFMDSHGCMVILVPCVRESDGALFGFTYRQSSEEQFFDEDPMEAIPIVGKEVVKIEYSPENGKEWSEIV